MSQPSVHRWQALPALLVMAGAVGVWVCAIAARNELGPWQWGLWIGGAAALAGALWFYRQLTQAELDLEAEREQLAERQRAIEEQTVAWETTRKAVESQLLQQAKQIESREQALSGKLTTFHEWMEFPQPLDLSQPHASDAELTELAKKDRLLNELLAAETKRVYDDILANKYVLQGEFQAKLVRDDALALVRRVAKIYQPDVEEPLLETSLAQVIRAASRACLQFLVLLEQLPLNVKEYSFSSLYGYIRQGVKAYGMYKSAEPLWPYMNTAYYIGRFAMGANLVTLAAWWFLGAWGKEGAKQLATQILQRQALNMLNSMVRVIGYEVAGMYGGDFRYRDPNWLYGVELAELVYCFPLSRESLSNAMKEVGTLQLRHEYDRVYLYRCIAAHASPDPERYRAGVLLSVEERIAIARRLERFLDAFVHGQTAERVVKWRAQVEERLAVKLNVVGRADDRSLQEQTDDAIRSLASFVIAVKEREPSELRKLLPQVKLYSDLAEAERERMLDALLTNPPFFFEQPTLDPTSAIVSKYLHDLAMLAASTAPHEAVIDDMLVDVAIYLRQDAKKMRQLLNKQAAAYLSQRLPADAPEKRFPPEVARAVLDVLAPGEDPQFVYGDISFEWPAGCTAPEYSKSQTWLVGVGDRLVVFAVPERPVLLWRGEATVTIERVRGYLTSDMRLHGGQWLGDARPEQPIVRVAGPIIAKPDAYFKPLQTFCPAYATKS